MWTVSAANSFQQAMQRFSNDTKILARDISNWFANMDDATRVLFFIMFILVLFYMIVRRPGMEKESGGVARQFSVALVIVLIFSFGITWSLRDGPLEFIGLF